MQLYMKVSIGHHSTIRFLTMLLGASPFPGVSSVLPQSTRLQLVQFCTRLPRTKYILTKFRQPRLTSPRVSLPLPSVGKTQWHGWPDAAVGERGLSLHLRLGVLVEGRRDCGRHLCKLPQDYKQ